MLLTGSSGHDIRRLRITVWLLLVLVLISSLVWAWHNLLPKANQSAFLLARQSIIERANYYKQQWLLSGKPTQLIVAGVSLNYTDSGWVKPIDDHQHIDCKVWLDTLYPKGKVLGESHMAIKNKTISSDYHCDYLYKDNQLISLRLINDKFIVMQAVDFEG